MENLVTGFNGMPPGREDPFDLGGTDEYTPSGLRRQEVMDLLGAGGVDQVALISNTVGQDGVRVVNWENQDAA